MCIVKLRPMDNSLQTYKNEILKDSSLKSILSQFSQPFSFPNGVDDVKIKSNLNKLGSHEIEKINIIKEFFDISVDEKNEKQFLLFGFVGRICHQKGVHLIVDVFEEIVNSYPSFHILVIVGGNSDGSEYSQYCDGRMKELCKKYPKNFWGNASLFFSKGTQLNKAADYFLMPSLFEPGGIVQHESLIAGTPVISFRTGGLNDTISEFSKTNFKGNGFLFDSHNTWSFKAAISKAVTVYSDNKSYRILRDNCGKSFIPISRVTKAWRGEFYRIFGKVSFDLSVVDESHASSCFERLKDVETYDFKFGDLNSNHLKVSFKTECDGWTSETPLEFNTKHSFWFVKDFSNTPHVSGHKMHLFVDSHPYLSVNHLIVAESNGFYNNVV